ncbi:MAG: hypothetical protein EOO15_01885 [Chitinophagaceae bacterium]|nr:MAG: hypothetical protein EOO15_01885 [Chitinophagaceae bacterium]
MYGYGAFGGTLKSPPMRHFHFILLLLLSATAASAQYARADAVALSVDASTPDSLAKLLTRNFTNDSDKVRAIFRWITANVRYQMRGRGKFERSTLHEDTAYDGRPADERTAYVVLRRREAVCEGYARLFNTLCREAGIRSVLVRGYVRNDSDPGNRSFTANHSWNAVWLDSSWRLLDATWAAGYVRSGSFEFTPSLDEFYYLTPPEQFARNHLPEDPHWSLLPKQPMLPEFRFGPFRTQAAQKYRVTQVSPKKGIIRSMVGDTLRLEVEMGETLYPEKFVAPLEPEHFPPPVLHGAVLLEPVTSLPARVLHYQYVVRPGDGWLLLQCNGETILRYRLEQGGGSLLAGSNE